MKRPRVAPDILRACHEVSTWRSIALCLGLYGLVVVCAWLGGPFTHYRAALPSLVLISALQHHLLILQHEGAHGLLHPRRTVNDLAADVFCAIPFLVLVRNYRLFHLSHHRYAGSPERDPERTFYALQGYRYERRGAGAVAWRLLRDFLGVGFSTVALGSARFVKEAVKAGRVRPFGARDAALYLVVWGGTIAASIHWHFWPELLLFWLLPQATLLTLLFLLHGYGEHTGASGPTEFERTWVHSGTAIENFFIYPLRSGFHLEHHLFPAVPWYRMKKLRRVLLEDPEYAARAEKVTATSYFFGSRSILQAMLLGRGEYYAELGAVADELGGDVVPGETGAEIDLQSAAN